MKEMNFRGILVNYIDVPENVELGFNFPFKILMPKELNENPNIIYACNLTSEFSNECNSIEELIDKTKKDLGSIDPILTHLCLENGNPMVIPYVPRFTKFRPNFLGRDCLYNNFNLEEEDKKFQNYMYLYNDLADQHKAIIEYAIEVLKNENINVDSKVIISGYSEGAKFASHLALLHPEIFKAVIAGGTGGVISMPISEINGKELKYPLGISDIKEKFNEKEFKKIKFFYYIGKKDLSDSAMPKFNHIHYIDENGNESIVRDECGNLTPFINDYDDNSKIIYILYYSEDGKREIKSIIINNKDLNKCIFYKNNKGENTLLFDEQGNQLNQTFLFKDNGDYLAAFDLFNDEEVNIVNKELGIRTQDRFKEQEKIYNKCELDCQFKDYNGNHRTIFDERERIFSDVDIFINDLNKKILK